MNLTDDSVLFSALNLTQSENQLKMSPFISLLLSSVFELLEHDSPFLG